MRNKASAYLKQMLSLLSAVVKAKSMALKSKSSAFKTRLIIFSLIKNKKVLLGSISDKINSLLGQEHMRKDDDMVEQNKAIVLHSSTASANEYSQPNPSCSDSLVVHEYSYEDEYPDLTHTLFECDGEDYEEQTMGSVIDLVKNSKDVGEEFSLEDEIDQVADLFITRFHRQLRLQKQHSIKRYQEMLHRSA
ncbi:hypothetical protein IFM89_030430 [Coptis chinensis]|uniref:DUF761 domain-containing protein n=1 Tax=Coptis chinensis TaxID=261450 RepID=A0A835HYE8_9MAGN|nr:hypothetical protein IFM89_030430 [Coptis chinensis]